MWACGPSRHRDGRHPALRQQRLQRRCSGAHRHPRRELARMQARRRARPQQPPARRRKSAKQLEPWAHTTAAAPRRLAPAVSTDFRAAAADAAAGAMRRMASRPWGAAWQATAPQTPGCAHHPWTRSPGAHRRRSKARRRARAWARRRPRCRAACPQPRRTRRPLSGERVKAQNAARRPARAKHSPLLVRARLTEDGGTAKAASSVLSALSVDGCADTEAGARHEARLRPVDALMHCTAELTPLSVGGEKKSAMLTRR